MEKFLIISLAALTAVHAATQAELDAVGMRCYKNGTYIERTASQALELLPSIDPSLDTHIYVHGFTESPDSNQSQSVIPAYINRGDINICALNWSEIAVQGYVTVALSGQGVGLVLANFLNTWTAANGNYDPSRLTLVGFSLGAQISGYAARNTTVRVPRITGLDPAGPGYNVILEHLQASDADFVCCMHSDVGFFGTVREVGCDFYPNGGTRIQPGCPEIFLPFSNDDFCSHAKSPSYYGRSVEDGTTFVASECADKVAFNSGSCNNNTKSVMGFATPVGTKGTYYLSTDATYPYGRNDSGAQAPPYI